MRDSVWNSIALAMMHRCAALLPSERDAWAAAMTRELDFIECPRSKVGFAAGCMWAAAKESTQTMDFTAKSIRLGAIVGMLVIALLGAHSAWRISAINPPTAMILGLSSVVFATAALWSLLRGPMALVQAATMMFSVYAFAVIFLSRTASATDWLNSELYRALATEGLIIWGVLLAAALFLVRALPERAQAQS